MIQRGIAVGSGKGGVGKTTVSANLALSAAKAGHSVALFDLDPLSNLRVLWSIPEDLLAQVDEDLESDHPDAHRVTILPRIDLFFPWSKAGRGKSDRMAQLINGPLKRTIDSYDLVILDLPAGIGYEENLQFLSLVSTVITVVKPEPTSHVSAGGFMKAVFEINPKARIHIWHTRYEPLGSENFHPADVLANYHRYVPDDMAISPDQQKRVSNGAFIPYDPGLDLLQAELHPEPLLVLRLREGLQNLMQHLTPPDPNLGPGKLSGILTTVCRNHAHSRDIPHLSDQLRLSLSFLGGDIDPDIDFHPLLAEYLDFIAQVPGRDQAIEALAAVEQWIETASPQTRGTSSPAQKRLDGAMASLFSAMARAWPTLVDQWNGPIAVDDLQNSLSLVQAHMALQRLMRHSQVVKLIAYAQPRMEKNGTMVRDSYRCVRGLLEFDGPFHQRFLETNKRIFPLFTAQLHKLSANLGTRHFIFRKDGEFHGPVYVRYLTTTLHGILHAGLGAVMSHRYSLVNEQFQKGLKRLSTVLGVTSTVETR